MNRFAQKAGLSWQLLRPFTLAAPALGMLSGGLTAYGAYPRFSLLGATLGRFTANLLVGALAAALLNAASNVVNQICDLEIDRVNKPERILPRGELSTKEAWMLAGSCYAISLAAALCINLSCFVLFALAACATILYSVPPFRTKRFGWWANVTIAIPRGVLLKVAGWSVAKIVPGQQLVKPEILFVKLDDSVVEREDAKLEGGRVA